MASPNPGGRPKALYDVQELARQHTEAAIDTLAGIMNDEKAPHSARLAAAEALLARGWGRPAQPTVETPGGGKTFEQWIREMDEDSRQTIRQAVREMRQADLARCDVDGAA